MLDFAISYVYYSVERKRLTMTVKGYIFNFRLEWCVLKGEPPRKISKTFAQKAKVFVLTKSNNYAKL